MKKLQIELDRGLFMSKFKFKVRKSIISLKRNYYVVPLFFVIVSCFQFLCSLFVFSPTFNISLADINSFDSSNAVVNSLPPFLKSFIASILPYSSIFLFLITLFSILYCVAYLNYALKKYGEKRPVHMLIIFFVLWAINIVLLLIIMKVNQMNLADEYIRYNKTKTDTIKNNIINCSKTNTLLVIHLILSLISGVIVITAPLVQKSLKKISFKPIENE